MRRQAEEFLAWGLVFGSRGLRGELKVSFLSPDGPNLQLQGLPIWFRRPGGDISVCHRVAKVEALRRGLVLRLEEVTTVEAAHALVGSEVLVRKGDLAALPNGRNYWFQLEGLQVIDRRHGDIGRLDDLFVTAAHPVYVVNGSRGEVLIPAVEQFIVEVDLDHRQMLVDLPEGLIPEADEI